MLTKKNNFNVDSNITAESGAIPPTTPANENNNSNN